MERIQKIIAASGLLSRRKAEEAILEGRVSVNGQVVIELGTKADPDRDEIRLDGKVLKLAETKTVLLFNKPRRVLTTKSDPHGRRTVMDYFPPELQTLKPIGRLDYDTEGLLLMTDDGDLANRLMHPRYGIQKIYESWVEGSPSPRTCAQMIKQVDLEDGPGRFESVRKLRQEPGQTLFEVVVSEGRNRFVRRMWEVVGHPVVALKRTRVGDLELGGLKPGAYRFLEERDLKLLGV